MKQFGDLTPKEVKQQKKAFSNRVARNVTKLRKKQGLSQEQLADKAGFYRTYIGHIETSTYSPSAFTLYRIAKALKVNISELID